MSDNHSFPSSTPAALLSPETLAALAAIDLTSLDLPGILTRIADAAQRAIAPAAEVSVTLVRGASAYTAAFTAKTALALDETQYAVGHGPRLDAAAGQSISIVDMETEDRWPELAAAARAAGVRGSVSVCLPMQDSLVGAINVYSREPHGFTAGDVALGEASAGYAAVAVANAHAYDDAATQARQMAEAMTHRAIIEQAKGILIAERRCSPDEAFAALRHLSNNSNRKLHDVAGMLVENAYQRTDDA